MKKVKVIYTVQGEPFNFLQKEVVLELSDGFFQSCFSDEKEKEPYLRKSTHAVVKNRLSRILEDLSSLQGLEFSGITDITPCEEAEAKG